MAPKHEFRFILACEQKALPKRNRTSFAALNGIFMTLGTLLIVLLILMLVGAIPAWPHSRNWGYRPSGGLGLLLFLLILLILLGRI